MRVSGLVKGMSVLWSKEPLLLWVADGRQTLNVVFDLSLGVGACGVSCGTSGPVSRWSYEVDYRAIGEFEHLVV